MKINKSTTTKILPWNGYFPFDITWKDIFCLAFYYRWKYFVLIDHTLSKPICLFCVCVSFSNIYPKIKFTAKNWSDLCNFYSKMKFCQRKYFLLFCVEFEVLMFHNYIVKNSEKKNEQAKLVEHLLPSDLPYRFLHNLHSFLLWAKK